MTLPVLKKKLFIVLKASRPVSWPFLTLFLGNGMLHSRMTPSHLALIHTVLQTFVFTIPLTIILAGVNDIYDYKTDRRSPRKIADGFEGGVLDPLHHNDVRIAGYISTIVILSSSLATQSRDNLIAVILLLILSWQYSAPPLHLKRTPLIDSLTNGCVVFLVWFYGFPLSGSSPSHMPLKAIVNNLCAVGVHALGAVLDFEADSAAGIKTIATTMGRRWAAIFAAVSVLLGSTTVAPVPAEAWLATLIVTLPSFHVSWTRRCCWALAVFGLTSQLLLLVFRLWKEASISSAGSTSCSTSSSCLFQRYAVSHPSNIPTALGHTNRVVNIPRHPGFLL